MFNIPLWCFFCLALFAHLFFSAFFPFIRFFYFAPFLVIAMQRLSLHKALWVGAFCGLFYDLLISETRFGLYSFLVTVSVALCYRFNRWFFEERLFSMPLYTLVFSFTFCLMQCLFWIRSHPFMPLFDALYSFLWFSCPSMLLKRKPI